jgi:hypothetical protein
MIVSNLNFANEIRFLVREFEQEPRAGMRQNGAWRAGVEWQECREKCSGGGRIAQRGGICQLAWPMGRFD